jgi:hypothetical protein
MKRTIPLFITFLSGLILIVATFIPFTQEWKNDVVIWFDILAGIAFVLGGGNLLMMHLKKVSDRKAGWGYSAIVLISFLATLILGTMKFGSAPEPQSDRYGETAAVLRLEDFPRTYSVPGRLPDVELPAIVKGQIAQENENNRFEVTFKGWMTREQLTQLKNSEFEVDWQETATKLFDEAQPPARVEGKIEYQAQLERLFYRGVMSDESRKALFEVHGSPNWTAAVNTLHAISNEVHAIALDALPPGYKIPEDLRDVVSFDAAAQELQIKGPMSREQHDQLIYNFPAGTPLDVAQKAALIAELEKLGPLDPSLVNFVHDFNKEARTAARRNHDLLFELLRVAAESPGAGLNAEQRQYLLADYDVQIEWEIKVGELFAKAHQVKFPLSGQYNAEGTAFWYIYQYMFQALAATIFSLLAFYVASAAFRAFRAKNVEATLLLITAFIVLLGRTYLGTWLTSWMPERLSGLTIPELTTVIMSVFATAGNRAIMIGIALGVVSTSLKILLAIDRSYLGSDRE